jgi:hypothetical protein
VPQKQIFISYSHKDKTWCDDLHTHLKPYVRHDSITTWSDQQIAPGSQWFSEIQSALTNCKVAVLLVSPDFLASDFIHQHELGPLLKQVDPTGVKILWVPIRGSAYRQTPLKNYQAAFDPSKPLASMAKAKRDQAWVKICEAIHKAAKEQDEATRVQAHSAALGGAGQDLLSSYLGMALEWENHLGHVYRSEGNAIYTTAVRLTAKNISDEPVRLEDACVKFGVTGARAEVVVCTLSGSVRPSNSNPIPANGTVTLEVTFNAPTGLIAQEIVDSWGTMHLSVTYDGATYEVPISEKMIRALYDSFRPNPIDPTVMRAIPKIQWSKDGVVGKSSKDHGYYKIIKEYVAEPGIEEERYIGYYQPGGHVFDPTGTFLNISGPIHGYKTLYEAQKACATDDEATAKNIGM